jgi:hypothetical protein
MTNTPINTTLRWTGPDLHVRMASGLNCLHCFRPLRPSGVRYETNVISLICERCHQHVMSMEPLL